MNIDEANKFRLAHGLFAISVNVEAKNAKKRKQAANRAAKAEENRRLRDTRGGRRLPK